MEKQPKGKSVSTQLVISDEVIASIAMSAAKDIEGVAGLVQRPKDIRSVIHIFEGPLKYVEVVSNDTVYNLKLYIAVKDGVKIPTVVSQVQSAVKNAVQGMGGCVVSKVNVCVADVKIKEKST
ncbi:MAG: Asp23/Gls24 family envelope stress response protein [Acutalibacteraceae bacterium]|nr:Asp23/Gls24 family envelope stress response protein [Acutalibacteraceae bacterium]